MSVKPLPRGTFWQCVLAHDPRAIPGGAKRLLYLLLAPELAGRRLGKLDRPWQCDNP